MWLPPVEGRDLRRGIGKSQYRRRLGLNKVAAANCATKKDMVPLKCYR